MNTALGTALRMMREHAKMTQEELATAMRCNVRSIQRAEAGHPVSADTLAGLGAVLGFDSDALIRNAGAPPLTEEQQEQMVREAEALLKDSVTVRLTVAASDKVWERISASDALSFHTTDVGDAVRDEAADLHTYLREYLDIRSELSPRDHREAEKEINAFVTRLNKLKAAVSYGFHTTRLRPLGTAGEAMPLTILVVLVAPIDQPKLAAVMPKAVQFE